MADNKGNIVGEKLKDFFAQKGIMQEDIAKELGVSQAYVSSMLNGKPFGKNAAKKWGELYGIQSSWLLTGEGDMLKEVNDSNETRTISNDDVVVSREAWDMIKDQITTIQSQQSTIQSQQRLIEQLHKKTNGDTAEAV